MVFSSIVFVFYFLPAALLLYYGLWRAPQRARNLSLVLLGYFFYGWANPRFVLIMLGTTLLDWLVSLVIAGDSWRFWRVPLEAPVLPRGERSRRQRYALTASILSNLGVLGFFKYFNFATDSVEGFLAVVGISHGAAHPFLRVALPLGISFYTFQSLSYTIDVYRGDARVMRSFIDFACFVSMFPHLVAGPILKFSHLAEQIRHRTLTLDKFARGVAFFSLGMGKKVLLANPCGKLADLVFNAGSAHPREAWFGAVSYAFQIYFDFSGYSDMAIGLGLMLGFVFARNFDSPYRSRSITEFWRRWHISLSAWLRDYLYIPLGGNRRGAFRTYFNLFITMLLGGLWHGASWNFVIWGAFHGGLLALERAGGRRPVYKSLPAPVRTMLTFGLVVVSWVFFRASDLHRALTYLQNLAGFGTVYAGASLLPCLLYRPYYLICFGLAAITTWLCRDTWEWSQHLTAWKAGACLSILWISVVVLATQSYNPFIYFIF